MVIIILIPGYSAELLWVKAEWKLHLQNLAKFAEPTELVTRFFLQHKSVLGSLAQGTSAAPCLFTEIPNFGKITVKLAL